MSEFVTSSVAETRQAHELLASFAQRYVSRVKFGPVSSQLFAEVVEYDPADPLCDYERTAWPAEPLPTSERTARRVLRPLHGMTNRGINNTTIRPFEEKAEEIEQTLRQVPLMVVSDHNPELIVAQADLGLSSALARHNATDEEDYARRLEAMFNISHLVATRGFAPIKFGWPFSDNKLSLVRAGQLIGSPHFSFPHNDKMKEAAKDGRISLDFIRSYNERFKQDCVTAARAETGHPDGYESVWYMEPSATNEKKIKDEYGKIIKRVIAPVSEGTVKLTRALGCAVLPVYTAFPYVGRKVMEAGDIIMPDQFTDSTLAKIMSDQAKFRRKHGGGPVYYAEDTMLV